MANRSRPSMSRTCSVRNAVNPSTVSLSGRIARSASRSGLLGGEDLVERAEQRVLGLGSVLRAVVADELLAGREAPDGLCDVAVLGPFVLEVHGHGVREGVADRVGHPGLRTVGPDEDP